MSASQKNAERKQTRLHPLLILHLVSTGPQALRSGPSQPLLRTPQSDPFPWFVLDFGEASEEASKKKRDDKHEVKMEKIKVLANNEDDN